MERFCDKCGSLVSGEGTFCPNCGAVMPSAVSLDKPASTVTPTSDFIGNQSNEQQTYNQIPTNQAQMPVYPQSYNNNGMQQNYQQMSVGSWVGTIILSCLGIIGLIFLFIWAFDSSTPQPKKNYARAYLLIMAIAVGLFILFSVLGFSMIGCLMGDFIDEIHDLFDYGQLSGLM
ncbi:MAG: zinc ribbon domain-containing protein [Ruminococcaceae bacterium]|nr:zinc ribbon domain-containing protein [Oscillospiraceae bacterium]